MPASLTESGTKAELWGRMLLGNHRAVTAETSIDFICFDEMPDSSHPDAFERMCERVVLSLLGKNSNTEMKRISNYIKHPEALRSPALFLNEIEVEN